MSRIPMGIAMGTAGNPTVKNHTFPDADIEPWKTADLKNDADAAQVLYGKRVFFFGCSDEDIVDRHLELF